MTDEEKIKELEARIKALERMVSRILVGLRDLDTVLRPLPMPPLDDWK